MIADGIYFHTAIVLGVTVNNTSVSGVPSSVYTTFICLECAGLLIAGLLLDPSKIRRNDGRPIASFTPLPWYQELKALGLTLLEPKMALITLSIYSSEMYLSLTGAFNAWYFNARTRSLANVSPTSLSPKSLSYSVDSNINDSSATGSSKFWEPSPLRGSAMPKSLARVDNEHLLPELSSPSSLEELGSPWFHSSPSTTSTAT